MIMRRLWRPLSQVRQRIRGCLRDRGVLAADSGAAMNRVANRDIPGMWMTPDRLLRMRPSQPFGIAHARPTTGELVVYSSRYG
jgi:hypothetical protein